MKSTCGAFLHYRILSIKRDKSCGVKIMKGTEKECIPSPYQQSKALPLSFCLPLLQEEPLSLLRVLQKPPCVISHAHLITMETKIINAFSLHHFVLCSVLTR